MGQNKNFKLGRKVGAFLLALILFTLISPPNVRATFYNVYGLGSRAIAMGGAYVAASNDTTALFYNPATLTECGTLKAELMVMRSFYDLNIEL
ncbi:MAG: hypothetical protein JSU92_12040 [Deltaproteobacteria bacterium]|nr:MAG: hypothetical protein JSU92_12040 [Deltaproteobacteria bacterium]